MSARTRIDHLAGAIVSRDLGEAVQIARGEKQPGPKHCIYCGIIVGETIMLDDGPDYEPYTMTDAGPVCEYCAGIGADQKRMVAGKERSARLKVMRKGHYRMTVEERQAIYAQKRAQKARRNEEIIRMAAMGMSQQQIGWKVGLSASAVGRIIRAHRRQSEEG